MRWSKSIQTSRRLHEMAKTKMSLLKEDLDSPRLRLPVSASRDHIAGSDQAAATLVEYGDYQCPFCGAAYPIVKKIQQKFGKDLRFVFRNFPITDLHPNAEFGAELAEASAVQGKFWEMHDFIYEHQNYLGQEEFFLQHAAKIGLDKAKIQSEIGRHAYFTRIREDFMSGVRSGVNGTPTFFLNDHRYNGDYEFDALAEAIADLLPKK
jgi:protein-disulfide isomerase